jgi:hypothetical protein
LTGELSSIAADALVIAETPLAQSALAGELRERSLAFEEIGDCVAPRRASLAFFEGRQAALRL